MSSFGSCKVRRLMAGVLCVLAVLLTACRNQPEAVVSQSTSITTQPEAVTSQPVRKSKPYVTNALRRSEYGRKVMEQWVDWDTFISAEMLESRFGSFEYFLFDAELESMPSPFTGHTVKEVYTDSYHYYYKKDTGGKYDLRISIEKLQADGEVRHLTQSTKTVSASDIDPNDLRKASKTGTYWLGEIGYTYWYDKEYDPQYRNLNSIEWKLNGYAFKIDIDERYVQEYSLDDGGFMAQLLRQETAPKAIEQFAKDLFPSQYPDESPDHSDENNKKWMLWIVVAVIVFFGIAATAFMLLRRKGKKNTAVMVTPPEEAQLEKET